MINEKIFTKQSRGFPIYIIAPGYSYVSRESRVMHMLCHHLNTMGEDAYIYPFPMEFTSDPMWPYYGRFPRHEWKNPRLNIKILSQEDVDRHFQNKEVPLCIVSDQRDMPFEAPFVARYILGMTRKNKKEFSVAQNYTFCYSKAIADYYGVSDVLFIPTVDLDYFKCVDSETRNGCAYYVDSNQPDYNERVKLVPSSCRSVPFTEKTGVADVREFFEEIESFYCVDDTDLAVEAVLCGCKVTFLDPGPAGVTTLSHELSDFKTGPWQAGSLVERDISGNVDIRSNLRQHYQDLPELISVHLSVLKSRIESFQYPNKIELPYTCKTVFVEKNVPEFLSSGVDKELGKEEIEVYGRQVQPIKRIISNFFVYWILPPRVTNFIRKVKHEIYVKRRYLF